VGELKKICGMWRGYFQGRGCNIVCARFRGGGLFVCTRFRGLSFLK